MFFFYTIFKWFFFQFAEGKMKSDENEVFDMRRNLHPGWSSYGKNSTHVFNGEATVIILKHNNSVPLFLYLARLDPHAGTYENTLQAPQEDIKKFQSIKD